MIKAQDFALEGDRPSKTSKLLNKLIVAALVIIAVSLGTIFYWASATESPLVLNKEPFPTRTIREHPTAGGVVFLTADFCKSTEKVGELRVSYESETREVFLPLSREESTKGCHNYEIPVVIPNDIPPDTYRVKLRLTYSLNPLKQEVTQIFYSYPVIIDPVTKDNQLPKDARIKSESIPAGDVR